MQRGDITPGFCIFSNTFMPHCGKTESPFQVNFLISFEKQQRSKIAQSSAIRPLPLRFFTPVIHIFQGKIGAKNWPATKTTPVSSCFVSTTAVSLRKASLKLFQQIIAGFSASRYSTRRVSVSGNVVRPKRDLEGLQVIAVDRL